MQNKKLTRKFFAQLFLVLFLAVGSLMPLAVSANDDGGPQEGGRGRRAPQTQCSSSSYDLIIVTITVTSCSDGSTTVTIS